MRSTLTALFVVVLLAGGALAQQKRQQDIDLQAAIRTEIVDGDLNAAIKQYSAIVSKYKADRAVAATALVHMAECYQKLGDTEAQKIYEQLIREYTDQKNAVAIARARLGGPDRVARTGGIALRKVWTDPNVDVFSGGISSDGRYLTYAGRYNTAVILRDLNTGAERSLTGGDPHGTGASAISKDGGEVAYDWCNLETCELWSSALQDGSVPPSRRLFANQDVSRIQPHDWSADGKRIAVTVQRKDRTVQIGWVAVADGSLRVLKSVDWRGPTRMFFSADGRDIAFDLPENDGTEDRDVLVLAADGSREIPAVVSPGNDIVIGWTPDGHHLLFASDRTGTMGLWALPFVDSKPLGAATLVKANIGNVFPLGITRSGALYTTAAMWDQDIEITSVDLTTGRQTTPPVKPIERFTGTNTQPAWSPDGKWLAYRSARGSSLATGVCCGPLATSVIGIRSGDTGEIRELRPELSYFQALTWAPDGESFVVWGADLRGREGVFRIDARSAEVTAVVVPTPEAEGRNYAQFFWSPDGRRLYYHTQNGTVHERDIASGTDRVVVSGKASSIRLTPDERLTAISVSPDGRWIAATRMEASDTSALVVIPTDGGEPRTLFRVNDPARIMKDMPWTPDGRAILAVKLAATGGATNELWQVPVDGTTPRKLAIDMSRVLPGGQGRIQLHPNGRQLAYVAGHYPILEVWVLENFLPAPPATRSSR